MLDEVSHQEDVVGTEEGRHHDRPEGVFQAQHLLHHDVPGNQAAAKEHREIEEERDDIAALEILTGEHIAGTGDAEQADGRAYDGLDDGIAVRADDVIRVGEEHVIRGGGPLLGEEGVTLANDFAIVGKGANDHQDKGQQADQ